MNGARGKGLPVPVAERVLALLFLAVVVASGYRFYLLRHVPDFTDENDHTVMGWLLTEGETLYGSVFAHHAPLPYLAAHLVALVVPLARPAHFRAVPWLAYLLVALLFVLSPIGRASRTAGLLAGSAFLVLVSISLPPFFGHLLLMDDLAGCGLAVFLAFVPLPAILRLPTWRRDDVVAGAAAGLALTASPMALFPLAAGMLPLLSGVIGSRARGRVLLSRITRVTAGAAASLLLVLTWLYRFGSLQGFVTDVIEFNREAYGPFLGEGTTSTFRLFLSGLSKWVYLGKTPWPFEPAFPRRIFLAFLFLAVGAVGATVLIASRGPGPGDRRTAVRGSVLVAAELTLILLVSRLRGFDFRALTLFIVILTIGALSGGLLLATGRRLRDAATCALFVAPLTVFSLRHMTNRVDVSGPVPWPPQIVPIAEYIQSQSGPAERIAVFNVTPRLYLESRRHPATDSLFYLPWQTRWEEKHPDRPTTCEQLRLARPRFVYLQTPKIWGAIDWSSYGGCIDQFVRENYRPLPDPAFQGLLWERTPRDSVVTGSPE